MIRPATLKDLDALIWVEQACFDTDRLTRRNFRYLLTRARAETLVYELNSQVVAYITVLFHAGTSLARIYSIAVLPQFSGKGIAAQLMTAAEVNVLEHDCISLRLEVRTDNTTAIRLYEKLGYRQFATRLDYYEDHGDALRYEKRLASGDKPDLVRVPFYQQTLDFTCGPSALMMGMKALKPELELSRKLELRLWRQSTTIYMTSGHGGCGPYGMALAAYNMGFDVEIYVNEDGVLFVDSVRSKDKKEVMRLVQEDFIGQIEDLPIRLVHGTLSVESLQDKFELGGLPIVLISSYRIYQEKFPHWVVVTGFDDRFIYVHDPYIDEEKGKVAMDSINMPILKNDFQRMAQYGKAGQKAALILYKRNPRG